MSRYNLRTKGGKHGNRTHSNASSQPNKNFNQFETLNDDDVPSAFGDASKTHTQLETLASTSKRVKLDSELDNYTSLLSDNISSSSNMKVDPFEEDTLDKGKQSIKPLVNPPLQNCGHFEKPPEFCIFADLRVIPGSTKQEKSKSLDLRFWRNDHYLGNRIMNFRGREIIKLYFDTQEAATNACTLDTSLHETDPFKKISFTIFSKKVIDDNIK